MKTFFDNTLLEPLDHFSEFVSAWRFVLEHGITDLDPWRIIHEGESIEKRSSAINGRYPQRKVVCFAERQDTDDIACLITEPGEGEHLGEIVILHDFSSPGSEIDATFPDFWGWFRAAVDDMIDIARHI